MPVEFLGIAATNDGSETTARSGAAFDKEYTLRLARAHEDHGWDRVLFAYGSGSPDPAPAAAYIASRLERLQILLAHRPNVSYPTYAAKTFATLDRISEGRLAVHFITGGNDHEQGREGDTLTKDERYARTREYIRIVKKIWTSHEAFDHEGDHYRFHDFVSDVFPVQQPRPNVSFGGSSPAAYAVGGAEADIYCLWGEPLEQTAQQIEAVKAAAEAAGRTEPPRIQVAFRPIIAPTEELAWEKAHRTVGAIRQRRETGIVPSHHRGGVPEAPAPQNTGSQRLIAIAEAGERYNRALWTPTAAATGGAGNSNALVGTPETVARALLDYYDLGVDILSARGYDLLGDAVDFGRYVIPLVREEVAKRDAERGAKQAAEQAAEHEARHTAEHGAGDAGAPGRATLSAVRG
ncbi:LLM class flavin-dependent oxidoreductase [Streptomyces sp. NPDC087917]|uniref:LLM class flavin-dependent oxidoreductase n=1 Tax=Streptomyces sp. NPDC087917 TaxID=3155060 RepID=UPI0034459E69